MKIAGRTLLFVLLFILLIGLANLTGIKKQASQEAIHYQANNRFYTHFINNPQSAKKQLYKQRYHQKIPEVLQGILFSKEKLSEATVNAFSQFFAEVYIKATDSSLSELENTRHAHILGVIIGHLTALRNAVIEQRHNRLLAGWYEYSEIDKRWLGLFTNIAPLVLTHRLNEQTLKLAQANNVDKFVDAVSKNDSINRNNNKDLVDVIINQTDGAITARFNGYAQETNRNIGDTFDSSFSAAYFRASRM